MWKAFLELKELGWIKGKLPKMVAVQADGCAPIVKAWKNGDEHAPIWENAYTKAAGIRVPVAVGDFLIIRAVRESNGFAISVSDENIIEARDRVAAVDGCFLCPEGAATMSAYEKAISSKLITPDEKVILFNCATGLKRALRLALVGLPRDPMRVTSQWALPRRFRVEGSMPLRKTRPAADEAATR